MIIASICKRSQIVLHFPNTSMTRHEVLKLCRLRFVDFISRPKECYHSISCLMFAVECRPKVAKKKLCPNAWGSKKRLDMISRPTRPKFSRPKTFQGVSRFLIFLLLVWLTFQSKLPTSKIQIEEKFLQQLNSKCLENDNSSCVMAKLLSYMNKMLKKPSFSIGKRITLLQTRSVWLFHFHRSLD